MSTQKTNGAPKRKVMKKMFKVESIRSVRVNAYGEKEYFIKWQGYSEDVNTWEPFQHIKHLKQVVKQWEDSQRRIYKVKDIKNANASHKINEIFNKSKKVPAKDLQNSKQKQQLLPKTEKKITKFQKTENLKQFQEKTQIIPDIIKADEKNQQNIVPEKQGFESQNNKQIKIHDSQRKQLQIQTEIKLPIKQTIKSKQCCGITKKKKQKQSKISDFFNNKKKNEQQPITKVLSNEPQKSQKNQFIRTEQLHKQPTKNNLQDQIILLEQSFRQNNTLQKQIIQQQQLNDKKIFQEQRIMQEQISDYSDSQELPDNRNQIHLQQRDNQNHQLQIPNAHQQQQKSIEVIQLSSQKRGSSDQQNSSSIESQNSQNLLKKIKSVNNQKMIEKSTKKTEEAQAVSISSSFASHFKNQKLAIYPDPQRQQKFQQNPCQSKIKYSRQNSQNQQQQKEISSEHYLNSSSISRAFPINNNISNSRSRKLSQNDLSELCCNSKFSQSSQGKRMSRRVMFLKQKKLQRIQQRKSEKTFKSKQEKYQLYDNIEDNLKKTPTFNYSQIQFIDGKFYYCFSDINGKISKLTSEQIMLINPQWFRKFIQRYIV